MIQVGNAVTPKAGEFHGEVGRVVFVTEEAIPQACVRFTPKVQRIFNVADLVRCVGVGDKVVCVQDKYTDEAPLHDDLQPFMGWVGLETTVVSIGKVKGNPPVETDAGVFFDFDELAVVGVM